MGSKTYDYLLKLMNLDTIAVDRHIFSFLEKTEIEGRDYHFSKGIVEFAADIMNVSRRSIDYSIWTYMAYIEKKRIKSNRLRILRSSTIKFSHKSFIILHFCFFCFLN